MAASLIASCAGGPFASPALAQPGASQIDPLDITGRDFAGMRLPLEVVEGGLELRASQAWTWTERPFVSPDGVTHPPVRRVLLEGDVHVQLALYRFQAARALVWLQQIPEGEPDAGCYQVFVYFDRVGALAGDAGVSLEGDRVPVEALLRPTSPILLKTDVTKQGQPGSPLIAEGDRALARRLRRMLGIEDLPLYEGTQATRRRLQYETGPSRPFDPDPSLRPPEELDEFLQGLPSLDRPEPIFAETGSISVFAGDLSIDQTVSGPDQNAAMFTDGVVIQYWDRSSKRLLELTAERAVVFLKPGELESLTNFKPEDVYGFYLEGNVIAGDGEYTLRGPRVYYDVQRNQAIVLDAVFWTYDAKRRMPLYVRADTIRQTAKDEFVATRAKLANTSFFEPQFSIGASQITVSRYTDRQGDDRTLVDARNTTLQARNIPFFYWPKFKGDPERFPLRELGFDDSGGNGPAVKTAWNALALAGLEEPGGFTSDLLADFYFDRGVALGTKTEWNRPDYRGNFFGYMLIDDQGTDLTKPGTRVDSHRDTTRGILFGDHQQQLGDNLSLSLEGSYIGDATFVDALFEGLGETRKEFTNRAYLRWADGVQAATFDAKGTFNDFIANEYLLQSQGYTVEKLPEASYHRIVDDLLGEWAPGLLTYTSENRVSRMSLHFDEINAEERGFDNSFLSERAFGLQPDQSFGDFYRMEGLSEQDVYRLDSRHEFSAQLKAGALKITPFTVGRITLYDKDFAAYSPNETDKARLWGSVGGKVSTEITKVDDGVRSKLFDLHRIRHIIEPGLTVWTAGTTIDQEDLPVYDDRVESILEGSVVRMGVNQTWQTKRGGPGRWRSVDFLRIDTELVFNSDNAYRESPIPRYFEYRPEFGNAGEFWNTDIAWQMSEAIAVSGNFIYDFEANQPARSSIGFLFEHTPDLRSFFESRFLNAQNSTFVDFGADYRISPKYRTGFFASYNTQQSDFQTLGVRLTRAFPNVLIGLRVSHDRVADETSFGFQVTPTNLTQGSLRFRGIGASDERARQSIVGD